MRADHDAWLAACQAIIAAARAVDAPRGSASLLFTQEAMLTAAATTTPSVGIREAPMSDASPSWLEYARKHWGPDWAIQRATRKAEADYPGWTFVTPGAYAKLEAQYKAEAEGRPRLPPLLPPQALAENLDQLARWIARR